MCEEVREEYFEARRTQQTTKPPTTVDTYKRNYIPFQSVAFSHTNKMVGFSIHIGCPQYLHKNNLKLNEKAKPAVEKEVGRYTTDSDVQQKDIFEGFFPP